MSFVHAVVFTLLFSAPNAESLRASMQAPNPQLAANYAKVISKNGGVPMVLVPAGDFVMGDDSWPNNKRHRVYLDEFLISKTPVTEYQFWSFCSSTGYKFDWAKNTPSFGWQGGDKSLGYGGDGGLFGDPRPMVNLSWDDARAFCKWAGGDLPTEAQWEKAARGTAALTYPWGNQWDGTRLQWSGSNKYRSASMPSTVDAHPTGASPYGCLDMAGNVLQWCLDFYEPLTSDAYVQNPTGPPTGKSHVCRGGSFELSLPESFQTSDRYFLTGSGSGGEGGQPGTVKLGHLTKGFRLVCKP